MPSFQSAPTKWNMGPYEPVDPSTLSSSNHAKDLYSPICPCRSCVEETILNHAIDSTPDSDIHFWSQSQSMRPQQFPSQTQRCICRSGFCANCECPHCAHAKWTKFQMDHQALLNAQCELRVKHEALLQAITFAKLSIQVGGSFDFKSLEVKCLPEVEVSQCRGRGCWGYGY